ncbi:MAG: FecR domain-containing protein [Verrucomicrobiales bacterium]|nr:FecR domain-containing protein [Verrucomicrobiales bacterium]
MNLGFVRTLSRCLRAARSVRLLATAWTLLVSAAATAELPGTNEVFVIEFVGQVEASRGGTNAWTPVKTHEVLRPGDQLRTGDASRATLQFSDRSVFRVNQSSVLEIRPPAKPDGWKELFLKIGSIFFLDRERPSNIRITTPTSTSAIRGTEFLLAVTDPEGTTQLSMFDGVVALASNQQEVEVTTGQQAQVARGESPKVSPLQLTSRLIQWCFYYPAVLDPADLSFDAPALEALAPALARYQQGDLPGAAQVLPPNPERFGDSAAVFAAALKLAVGQLAEFDALAARLSPPPATLKALSWLVAIIRQEEVATHPVSHPSTPSEWLAWSFVLQSRFDLPGAAHAAKQAHSLDPAFGHAWIRYAELEWSLGHANEARRALAKGRELSPRNPRIGILQGFLHLAAANTSAARESFQDARDLDGAVGDAWLGLALCAAREGDSDEARRLFQIAAAMEPQRAVTRSYLGRAFDETRNPILAGHEFDLALRLDPADPTAWLYRGMHHQQTHALNSSVLDFQESLDRNDNRGLFRSRLLLDEDRATRQADLSISYAATGLSDVAARTASRAIEDDYANASAHLMRARALHELEDPRRVDLRLEASRANHLLLANLLAPPGAANLSQQLSQQDYYRAGSGGLFHGSSLSEYRSSGDWTESATLFGSDRRFAYALDGQWQSLHGERPNAAQELAQASLQLRQNVTEDDGLFLQAGMLRREGGDPSRLYDPETALRDYRFHEWQEPSLALGYTHAWGPGSHTLLLVSHVEERLEIYNPEPDILFLRHDHGQPTSLLVDPFFDSRLDSRFPLTSAELQQIWQTPDHLVVAGVGYQTAELDSTQTLNRELSAIRFDTQTSPEFSEARGYAYYTYRGWRPLQLTAGAVYQDITFPRNAGWAPISDDTNHRTELSPKAGFSLTPWHGGVFRGAFAPSLGSQDFASSLRLEPSEIGGFTQTFQGISPAASTGVLVGQSQQMLGLAYDQRLGARTFVGIAAEELRSWGSRDVGYVTHSGTAPVPDQTGQLSEHLDFRELALSFYATHLIGNRWAVGLRYRLSDDQLESQFPTLPADLPGLENFAGPTEAVLHELEGFALFNHECGFYAQWSSHWRGQHSSGGVDAPPDESFWQHDLAVGYRFHYRQADLRLGLLNLFDQDYRLNPLNPYHEPPRRRTLQVSLRINF